MKIAIKGFTDENEQYRTLDTIDVRDINRWVKEHNKNISIGGWECEGSTAGYELFSYLGEEFDDRLNARMIDSQDFQEVFELTKDFDYDLNSFKALCEVDYGFDIDDFDIKDLEKTIRYCEDAYLIKADSWLDLLWDLIDEEGYSRDDFITNLVSAYISEDDAEDYLWQDYEKTSYGFLRNF